MKYIKLFEEINIANTNINELKESFVSDIKDICLELDDVYRSNIFFYNPHFRERSIMSERNLYKPERFLLEYPSIYVTEAKWRHLYGWEDESKIWTKTCIETANRIKDYLGDNYKLFIYIENNPTITRLRPELFTPHKDFKYDGKRVRSFEIVYDPKEYIK